MTAQQYRDEGYRIYEEDMDKAVSLFKKAAAGKDIPAAMALASYYYDEQSEENTAEEWVEKAFGWFGELKKPEELLPYIAFGHLMIGKIRYECELNYADAWIEFSRAADDGNNEALAYMGTMLYEGDWTPDGDPDINGALELWEAGMELGDQRCRELYEEHKAEYVKDARTVKFENGDVYKGDVNEEGLPHGSGHMDYNLNGYYASYDGLWENGKRSGQGHYHSMSKSARRYTHDYKGQWLEDQPHGEGVSEDSSEVGSHCATVRETYTGGFREGKRHGHGVLVTDHFDGSFTDGKDRIEGEWEDGKFIGSAVYDYANGDRFEGPQSGHGVYTFADGLSFEGEWEAGRLIPESITTGSGQKSPLMIVKEHHQGFDYNNTGVFLFPAKTGKLIYGNAAVISKDSDFSDKRSFEISNVTEDAVTFTVKGKFVPGGKDFEDTLRCGESRRYVDSREATATIYDDDYDYIIEDSLEVRVL